MTSWLRVVGLRVALLCALVATVVVTHLAVAKPSLPFALVDSFDRAFALVYDAAERKVAKLEGAAPVAVRRDVQSLLRELEEVIAGACEAASTRLDVELVMAASLSAERRGAVIGCIEHHLREARKAMRRTADPRERAEYEATCERLRDVRRMV